MVVVRSNDATGEEVFASISGILGEPSTHVADGELRWANEDLLIKLTIIPAGPFDPPVSYERLSREDQKRRWSQQSRAMEEHLCTIESPCEARCAIIERAEALRDSWEDPHFRGKTASAKVGIVPQGLIARPSEHEARKHSVESAVRDCFRMLGVLPLHPNHKQPATVAITTILDPIDHNNKRKMCVATRAFGDVVECAVVSADGVLEWVPYAEFLLRLLRKSAPNRWFPKRGDSGRRLVAQFIQKVIDDCQSHSEPVLLLMDMDGLSQFVPALQNGELQFDRIRLAGTVLEADAYDNVAVVRHLDGSSKMPQHHPRVGAVNERITAGPSGCFRWANNERTLYAIKSMPQTAMSSVMATKNSRHAEDARRTDSAHRAAADFDEMCLLLKPEWCDPMKMLVRTARLKGVHAQYPGYTQVPFPLHEARALGRQT